MPSTSSLPANAAPLHALLYRSVASAGLTVGDVLDIFAASRRRNAELGVTGLLLYTGASPSAGGGSGAGAGSGDRVDQFAQWLEGPEEVLRDVYARISRDPRHHSCEMLLEGPSADLVGNDERLFPTWSMRFGQVPALPVTAAGLRRAADRLRRGRRIQPRSEPAPQP